MKHKPQIIKTIYGYLKVFIYDIYRFVRYSGVLRKHTYTPSRGALMTKYYHMVEKGLTLPEPRPGFGSEVTTSLSSQIRSSVSEGVLQTEVSLSLDALDEYVAFNKKNTANSPKPVIDTLEEIRSNGVLRTGQATKTLKNNSLDSESHLAFLRSRVSVRDFAGASVPKEVLIKAVRAAQFAPCVCNRQASRAYFLTSAEDKKKALSYQLGNRGFGESAAVIAIITTDIAELLEPTERYQHWIDGGLFAQNFLLGIHAQGYGACPLNWSAPITRDIGIRKLGYIPNSESIIMMVAIGALKDEYKVARSERRPVEEVAHFVDQGNVV